MVFIFTCTSGSGSVYSPVPMGKGHHDVEGGQEEHKVKETVTVGDSF